MQYHTSFLNKLIEERGYTSFLEIGYGTGSNFRAINVKEKTSVDPAMYKDARYENTDANIHFVELDSDTFFNELDGRKKYDLVFIDGLHHSDQVERDITNAWKHLKKGGAVVLHDVNPANEEMTIVPRQTKQWTGDIYRAFDGLVTSSPELKWSVDPEDFGLALIEFDKDIKIAMPFVSGIDFATYKAKYFGA